MKEKYTLLEIKNKIKVLIKLHRRRWIEVFLFKGLWEFINLDILSVPFRSKGKIKNIFVTKIIYHPQIKIFTKEYIGFCFNKKQTSMKKIMRNSNEYNW